MTYSIPRVHCVHCTLHDLVNTQGALSVAWVQCVHGKCSSVELQFDGWVLAPVALLLLTLAPQEAVVVLVWSLVMHVISTTYHGQPVSPQADNLSNFGYWLI